MLTITYVTVTYNAAAVLQPRSTACCGKTTATSCT